MKRGAPTADRLISKVEFDTTGTDHPRSKLSEEAVRRIRSYVGGHGHPLASLAKELGVSKNTVMGVRRGRVWGHVV